MREQFRENYFPILKLLIGILLIIYLMLETEMQTGAASVALLLLALFVGFMTAYEIIKVKTIKIRILILCLIGEGIIALLLFQLYGQQFALLFGVVILEALSASLWNMKQGFAYLLVYLALLPAIYIGGLSGNTGNQAFILSLLIVIYFQHGFVIRSYQKQLQEDIKEEEELKKNIFINQTKYLEDLRKNRIHFEDKILKEKASISQTLHDKLGHSINGSLYQLEASKLLIHKEPEQSSSIIQAVIDTLRASMDDIRETLKRVRPDRHKLSLLQIQELCEDCKTKYGIDAELTITGDGREIPDKLWEIILDNTFEAFTNALKYANCSKIIIQLVIMNKLVRCNISDDGVGTSELVDGMGISGMRKRVRSVNGILDFETSAGFSINMLLPLSERHGD